MSFSTTSPKADTAPPPAPRRVLQRKCSCGGNAPAGGECEECKKQKLQRRGTDGDHLAGTKAPPIVHEVLRSSGDPLDAATRAGMEQHFSTDFGDVRIHTGAQAGESASAVQAHAYTVGRHVVFGPGEYSPHTEAGSQLLAHELAHTIQQRQASGIPAGIEIGPGGDSFETQADALSRGANPGVNAAGTAPTAGPRMQRVGFGEVRLAEAAEEAKKCEVKSEGTVSNTSWGETSGLYPTSVGTASILYDPAKWNCTTLYELLKCRGAIHAVCQRGQSCKSSSPPAKDEFVQKIKKYHYTVNFPALDPEIADEEVKWLFLSPKVDASHPGITGGVKVKSYGPFWNVGGGDVKIGLTYVHFYKVPATK